MNKLVVTVHVSFTSTFLAWVKGTIEIAPEHRFRFNCSRKHVVQENPEKVPYEVAWHLGLEIDHNQSTVWLSELPRKRQLEWFEFAAIIGEAERLGNVKYQENVYEFNETWLTEDEKEEPGFMEKFRNIKHQQKLEIAQAISFAKHHHGDQKRKYSDAPYFQDHCLEVYDMIRNLPSASHSQMIAAILHDVVEDTPVSIHDISMEFGENVGRIVAGMTDVSRPEDGNRKLRKQKDLEHTAEQKPDVKTVKLADLISNSRSIFGYAMQGNKDAKAFAKLYSQEKERLMMVLVEGDHSLYQQAEKLLQDYTEWVAKN
jgi:HD domain